MPQLNQPKGACSHETYERERTSGRLALARPVPITAVVTDSRKVQPGCIFVCFPGERVDGHDYAAKAYQAGAEYVIANHPVEGVPEDHLVICESSYLAMIRMASNYRTLFSPLMIGVTGSVGKTTTKEFCYAVLRLLAIP